jgi:acyl-CoA synthetase (NDP forming)
MSTVGKVGRVVPDEPSSTDTADLGSAGRVVLPTPSAFVHEAEAYAVLARAGLQPPRHAFFGDTCPFGPEEPVVLKGLGDELWHKSELGAVHFLPFDEFTVEREVATMRVRIEAAGHRWIGGLVCEKIPARRNDTLPTEGFVSLSRGDAGWTALFGFGGLQADALAELAAPCCWPLAVLTQEQALAELERHLLGRIWLGQVRGARPLTTIGTLRDFLSALWRLAGICEHEGISLLELNPVVLDQTGQIRPLDAVGRRAAPAPARLPPPAGFLDALRSPNRIALAGVSSEPGGVGRTILDNLRRYNLPSGDLILIKPGHTDFLGLPCLPDVAPLVKSPVDLLLLALPAPAAAATLSALIRQGGGARCVALVSGGIGDGADRGGLGERLRNLLHTTRKAGRWTPAVLGPNFLGHWVPAASLDTSFIPVDKLAPPAKSGGELTLLSQSGAFLLSRRSANPALRFSLGLALGNQMDVSMADVLASLAELKNPGPVACYIEGFGPGQLEVFARAAQKLAARGVTVLVHRAGRTEAGQASAASHTGAMAGDLAFERTLLRHSGVRFADSIADFDTALAWLGAQPRLRIGPTAVLTNAGFESVNASDLLDDRLPPAGLNDAATRELTALLQRHGLAGLVAPRLPLDLTPMAGEAALLDSAALLLRHATALVVGLVPFTRKLDPSPVGAARFAGAFAAMQRTHGKPVGIVIDAGNDYAAYRAAFAEAGLPVFTRMESALRGLWTLA